jgi:chemotaxis protein MotA
MFAIIGIVVVIIAILGGFLLEHGPIAVLVQPAELLIVAGAALGTVLIANPVHILKEILIGLIGVFKGSRFKKQLYLDTLKMFSEMFSKARREGLVAMESDIEEPDKSAIFTKYPFVIQDQHLKAFICDTMRLAITGGIDAFDVDQMMEADLEVSAHGEEMPSAALTTMADSLPGLGIVAAVLGIVITMGALGGPPEEIGKHVAAALVGTFLGILLCYGFVSPLAANMNKTAAEAHSYYNAIRVCLITFIKGNPPVVAIEMSRRSIPTAVRPTFQEVENYCKHAPAAAVTEEPVSAGQ